jgi:putative MATE family efflux protein
MANVRHANNPVGAQALTSGPILRTLIAFALPTLASNVVQSLNGSINAVWVGRLLGKTGLAATSNANLIMFMVFSLIFGFGMATTVLIGQTMGRRDIDGMRRTLGAGVGLFLAIGLGVTVLGWFEAPALLQLLGTPADVYARGLAYTRVMFLGLPAGLLTVYLQMALRGMGDSRTPLLFILPSALIDVGLNPVLILGLGPAPRLGIAGSAAAGVTASYVTLVLLLGYIYRRNLPMRLRGAEWRYLLPAPNLVLSIVRMGAPMGLQMIVTAGSALTMMGLVNHQGTNTVAAYGATNQLWTYIQMPAIAVGMAVSAMAAQNIGAGRWDRINRIAIAGVAINLLMTIALVVSVTLPDRAVLSLFLGRDAAAIDVARHINLLSSWSFSLLGVTMVLSAVPRANGATLAPLVIITLTLIPGRLGFVYLLTPILGAEALWWSFPAGSAIGVILTALYYYYGGWRNIRVLALPTPDEAEEIIQTEAEPTGRIQPAG